MKNGWILCTLTALTFFSCGKEPTDITSDALSKHIEIINREGQITNSIKEGEDFGIRYVVRNVSQETLTYSTGSSCCTQAFSVYDLKGNPVGKPDATLPCPAVLEFFTLEPGEQDIYHTHWLNNTENKHLEKGEYRLTFHDQTCIANAVDECREFRSSLQFIIE